MLKRTFTKVLFLFLLIIALLLAFSLYVFNAASTALQDQIYESISQNTENITYQLEDTLMQLYEQNSSLVSLSNIRKLAKISNLLSEYERITAINQLREQISIIPDSNTFVSHVCVYIHDLNKVFNSSSYSRGSFQSITEEQYFTIASQAASGATTYYTNPVTNEDCISIMITSADCIEDFIIEIVLSKNAIEQYLMENLTFGNDYFYVVLFDQIVMTNIPDSMEFDLSSADIFDTADTSPIFKSNQANYYRVVKTLPYIKGQYLRLVDTNAYVAPMQTTANMMLYLILLCVIAALFFFTATYNMLHKPLKKLMDGFKHIEKGDFDVQLPPEPAEDFNYIYQNFNSMTQSITTLIEQDYNQTILLQKAELKQLQSQINPHFLYNSFFLLQRMIKTGQQQESIEMSNMLGQYFRYITKNSMDEVPLKDEYHHATLYAQIQSLRFDGRIVAHISPLPAAYENLPVPKLILQPLLENAFNHGLDQKLSDGIIAMYCETADSQIHIIVEDNSDTLTEAALQALQAKVQKTGISKDACEMTGIFNIKRRLELFSHNAGEFNLTRSPLGGLRVTIILQDSIR